MTGSAPRVSIGVPVYNGERYLRVALDSLLEQTFTDFELIISDNTSTDGTAEICHEYAARDRRVRHVRQAENIGLGRNWNAVFALGTAPYWKWHAYDDVCAPTFLGRCVAALDDNQAVVAACTRFVRIDEYGSPGEHQPWTIDLLAPHPHRRFAELMSASIGFHYLYGVIRRETLASTGLYGTYWGADRALIAEIILRGELYEVPAELFGARLHPERFSNVTDKAHFHDPQRTRRVDLMHLEHARNYVRILARAPLDARERLLCVGGLLRALRRRAPVLLPVLAREVRQSFGARLARR